MHVVIFSSNRIVEEDISLSYATYRYDTTNMVEMKIRTLSHQSSIPLQSFYYTFKTNTNSYSERNMKSCLLVFVKQVFPVN